MLRRAGFLHVSSFRVDMLPTGSYQSSDTNRSVTSPDEPGPDPGEHRMAAAVARVVFGRVHYGWIVVGVTFLVLLAGAGVRSTPSVLIVPFEQAFGWSRASISFAIGVNIFLYGLVGPFAAAAMQRFGIRRVVVFALALLVAAIAASTLMTAWWQLVLTWGLLVGLGTGITALVLGATIPSRWFSERRGLAMGIPTASTATGQLVFLPMLAAVAETSGWRPVAWIMAGAAAAAIPLVLLLLPERPADLGLRAYGERGPGAAAQAGRANPVPAGFPRF